MTKMHRYSVTIATTPRREVITSQPLTPAEKQAQIENVAALYHVDKSAVKIVEERRHHDPRTD